jgi:hypothetical protein
VLASALPSLLDIRAAALLARNAPAAACAARTLSSIAHVPLSRSGAMGAPQSAPPLHDTSAEVCSEDEALSLLLQALPLLPDAESVLLCGSDYLTQPEPQLLQPVTQACTAVRTALADLHVTMSGSAETSAESVRQGLAAARALLDCSSSLAGSGCGPAHSALAAQLALYAGAALQRVVPLLATTDAARLGVLTEVIAQEAGGVTASDASGSISTFACTQALSLRALAAAETACKCAEASLTGSTDGRLRLGRWPLVQLLLHAGECSTSLLGNLGLGAPPSAHCSC